MSQLNRLKFDQAGQRRKENDHMDVVKTVYLLLFLTRKPIYLLFKSKEKKASCGRVKKLISMHAT